MPLLKNSTPPLGGKLFVLPYYGYGWAREDLQAPPLTPLNSLGPEPFYIRADEFVVCNNLVMGVIGVIAEPKHELDCFSCTCLLRDPDDCNFTDKAGHYLIWITKKKPEIDPVPHPDRALYDWIKPDRSEFILCGYGMVAESVNWINDTYNLAMKSREQTKKTG